MLKRGNDPMHDLSEDYIKRTVNVAIGDMVIESIKESIVQPKRTALERTKEDLKQFKAALKMLADERVQEDSKKQVLEFSIRMQKSLKWIKERVSEQEFILFYKFNFNKQSQRTIAAQYGIDEKTVKRANETCMNKLSLYLYPDLYMDEILS
jgi:predicted Holliday junction resolvase-like endonuclease